MSPRTTVKLPAEAKRRKPASNEDDAALGVTGARENLPEDLPALIRRARHATKLPLAVGFGISLPGHVSILGGLADAAVVGSALMEEIARAASPAAAASAVAVRIRSLKEAAGRGLSRRETGA